MSWMSFGQVRCPFICLLLQPGSLVSTPGFLCYIYRNGGWRGQSWDASRWERNPNYRAAEDRHREVVNDVAEQLANMRLAAPAESSSSDSLDA